MEKIFGAERATLKKAISQGGNVGPTLERLFALNAIRPAGAEVTNTGTGSSGGGAPAQPRAMWSTSMGSHPSGDRRASESSYGSSSVRTPATRSSSGRAALPTPVSPARAAAQRGTGEASAESRATGPARRSSTRLPLVLGVVLVLGGLGVAGAVAMRGERSFSEGAAPRAGRATASLEIQSEPAGAHIFVDGSPSGLRTPATLTGLAVGITVRVSLDKPGYEPAAEAVNLSDARPRTISLTLKQAAEVQQRSNE
jgi:hypothetical protein